jgi:hypothetical protein
MQMTREQLLEFLTRVVRDRRITERQAAELLLAFDEGRLDPADLPEEQEDDDLIIVLPWVVAALVILLRRLGYPANPQRLIIPPVAREALQEVLRAEFQVRSRALAAILHRTGDINAWQKGMADLIKRNMIESATVGAGRILTLAELRALEPMAEEQMAFLARFADRITIGNLMKKQFAINPDSVPANIRPMTFEAIAARSELYGRMGISFNAFFNELAAGYGPGWIVDYISMDDGGVCSNCIDNELRGPYLPNSGPFPAENCYGGSRCRCRREARFDPVAYARLTDKIAA